MDYPEEIEHINVALVALIKKLDDLTDDYDYDLANAIDHLGHARELLGGEDFEALDDR